LPRPQDDQPDSASRRLVGALAGERDSRAALITVSLAVLALSDTRTRTAVVAVSPAVLAAFLRRSIRLIELSDKIAGEQLDWTYEKANRTGDQIW